MEDFVVEQQISNIYSTAYIKCFKKSLAIRN